MDFLEAADTAAPKPPEDFWTSVGIAVLMMFVAEIGDKTFICAAVCGAVKDMVVVVTATQCTMILMILVSIVSGDVVTDIAGAGWVNIAAIVCFGLFAIMYFRDAWNYTAPVLPAENADRLIEYEDVSRGVTKSTSERRKEKIVEWLNVFWRVAVLIFFAEWADRTQFSVATLSKEYDPTGVGIGSFLGQGLCTVGAVVAARYVMGEVPRRRVLAIGGLIFLGLGLYIYFWNPGRRFVGQHAKV